MIRRLLGTLARGVRAVKLTDKPARSMVFNDPEIYWNQSYGTPLDSKPNGKVVVFGLPKSGNVWLKSLVADYFDLPGVEPVLNVENRGVGICHWAFRPEFVERGDFLHAVYIMRDIRDIVVSFFHYSQTERFLKARPEFHYCDIESFYYEWFLSRMVTTYRWHVHAAEYAALGVPIVRYESLHGDTAGEFERLVRRWGLEVDRERIGRVVKKNSISELQRTGKQLDVFVPSTHFRKGGSGNYREELPPQILRDINERFAEILSRWGYRVVAE